MNKKTQDKKKIKLSASFNYPQDTIRVLNPDLCALERERKQDNSVSLKLSLLCLIPLRQGVFFVSFLKALLQSEVMTAYRIRDHWIINTLV